MKYHAPLPIAVTLCLLTGAPLITHAQTNSLPPVAPPVFVPAAYTTSGQAKTVSPTVPRTNVPPAQTRTEAEAPSITTLLKLDATVILRLDRAYENYARTRFQQEAQIENWQNALRTAHAATTFDERKASQLSGNISDAEHKVADAYLKARGESLAALTSVQRIRLERLEASDQPIRDDKYRFLLLSQIEDLWRTPIDAETGQYLLNAANAQQTVQQNNNYYVVPQPYPVYGYDTYISTSYDYGYQPFYSHSNSHGDRDRYHSSPRDKDARPLWNRDSSQQRPAPSVSNDSRQPLYQPQPSDSAPVNGFENLRPTPRPQEDRKDGANRPREDRNREPQRETPRHDSDNHDTNRREPSRPEPPRADPPRQEQPRPEPPRPEPPKPEPAKPDPPKQEPSEPDSPKSDPPKSDPPKQPERNNDGGGGGHWDRGGGGRGR